jgi:hypothetical protein
MGYGLKSFAHPGWHVQHRWKDRCVEPSGQTTKIESGDNPPQDRLTHPNSPLKKGTGSELTRENPPKNDRREVPVPFFIKVSPEGEGFIPSHRETAMARLL